jgi:cytoskeletal protein CcmA (bactofilin family)
MPEPEGSRPAPLVIAAGASFSGLLVLRGRAQIDGRVRGEIVGAEQLRIGESAEVEARVEAQELLVAGSLEGEVRAARRVELLPTARVRGRLETARLVVADGSFLEGRCHIPETGGAGG